MKVKDLKSIINGCDDNLDVAIFDSTEKKIQIVGGGEVTMDGFLCLWVRQEFPDEWFDKSSKEFRYVNGCKVIPVPDAVETEDILVHDEELGIDEICLTLTFYDGYAQDKFGNLMTYPKVGDLTDEQLEEIDRYTGGRVSDSGVVTPNDVCLLFGKLVDYGIMDTAQNHDEDLVKEINLKWLRFREEFRPILIALYTRDIEEITDSDAFQIPSWLNTEEYEKGVANNQWTRYKRMALADMTARWDEFANNYLMHIADGQDLDMILKFVRYDVSEDARHS